MHETNFISFLFSRNHAFIFWCLAWSYLYLLWIHFHNIFPQKIDLLKSSSSQFSVTKMLYRLNRVSADDLSPVQGAFAEQNAWWGLGTASRGIRWIKHPFTWQGQDARSSLYPSGHSDEYTLWLTTITIPIMICNERGYCYSDIKQIKNQCEADSP